MPIDFQNNQILFNPPQVLIGAAALNTNQPQQTPLPNGFSVANLTYTLTARPDPTNPANPSPAVNAYWECDRNFQVVNTPVQPSATVTIRGSTNITVTASRGPAFFAVRGEVISVPGELINDSVFQGRARPAANPNLQQWNVSGATEGPLNVGAHTLTMESNIRWRPVAIGDSVTVSSEYVVTVEEMAVTQKKYTEVRG